MTGQQRVAVWITAVLSLCMVAGSILFFIIRQRPPAQPLTLTGAALIQDKDPRKQHPLAGVEVMATNGTATMKAVTDTTGYFTLTLPPVPDHPKPPPATLTFTTTGYHTSEIRHAIGDQIYLAYLKPEVQAAAPAPKSQFTLSNVRVRYSEKARIVNNTGSLVHAFEVVNKGNVPCNNHNPCSPDGKWKATIGTYVAERHGQEFRHPRLSCIAGPCRFTAIEPQTILADGDTLKVVVRNWSDTTTFLVEAEVSQTILSDMIRESYPATFGASMNFTLPAAAEGPSIEAELNGQEIVFPLGPALIVSWGVCSMKVGPGNTKLYRCDLKPGYAFAEENKNVR
jgi:hypothetical protein